MMQRLLERRVPQWVAVYVAGGWGFVQFVDWAVDEYSLAPHLTTLIAVLLLLLLPSVAFLAWRHGAAGASEWTRSDAGFLLANAGVATVALCLLYPGLEASDSPEIRMVENAEGDTVARIIPAAADMEIVLLFDFENRTDEAANDWLEHGLSFAIDFDLLQDPFVGTVSQEDGEVTEMRSEAGLGPYDPTPLPLKRIFAQRKDADFFFDGTIESDKGGTESGGIVVRTRLFATSSGNEIASHSYEFIDPQETADVISRDLREDLGFEAEHLAETPDFPVPELITDSPDAFRSIAEARVKEWREGRTDEALRLMERALELDSTAALAHFGRSVILRRAGDEAGYAEAQAALSRYAYRLPERLRLEHQVWAQLRLRQDVDAAIRAARYWTEVYPADPRAHHTLAEAYEAAGDLEGELRARKAALALEPDALSAKARLADSYADAGLTDSALAYYGVLRDDHPDQLDLRHIIGQLLADEGRFDEAREELTNALAAAPGDPDFRRELAVLELRAGNVQAAQTKMREVPSRNMTPRERERWAGFRETLSWIQGRFGDLEAAYRERLDLLPDILPPKDIPGAIDNSEFLLYAEEAGRSEDILEEIGRLQAAVDPPHNLDLEWPAALQHVARGNVREARASLAKLRRLGAADGDYQSRRAQRAWLEGRIAELESGDCRGALPFYEEAARVAPRYMHMRLTLMSCHARLRDWDEAGEHADWLVRTRPGFPTVRLAVARYHLARGDEDEARVHLDAALRLWSSADPDYRPAREARALAEELGMRRS